MKIMHYNMKITRHPPDRKNNFNYAAYSSSTRFDKIFMHQSLFIFNLVYYITTATAVQKFHNLNYKP